MKSEIREIINEATSTYNLKADVLNEAKKSKEADKVVSFLYRSIKRDSFNLDFEFIDETNGDINKLKNLKDINNAIAYLDKINSAKHCKETEKVIKTLKDAINILHINKTSFMNSYKGNGDFLIKSLYRSIIISIIFTTTLTVNKCIKFVNDGIRFQGKLDNNYIGKIEKNNIYLNLKSIVSASKNGKLVLKPTSSLLNEGFLSGISSALTTIAKILNPIIWIHHIIKIYYYSRIKISEYLKQLSDLTSLNMENVSDPKIKEKQEKWVNRLEKMSEKLSIDTEVATKRGTDEVDDEYNQYDSSIGSPVSEYGDLA